MGNLGSSFPGNLTIWREIMTFHIKKYIRHSVTFVGNVNFFPGNLHIFQPWCKVRHLKMGKLYCTANCTDRFSSHLPEFDFDQRTLFVGNHANHSTTLLKSTSFPQCFSQVWIGCYKRILPRLVVLSSDIGLSQFVMT